MEDFNDIIKRFKFDLEVGVFKRLTYIKAPAYAFKGSKEELGFLISILDILGFEVKDKLFENELEDIIVVFMELKEIISNMSDETGCDNEIPIYIKEYFYGFW